jgi:hypothetical protein
MQLNYIVWLLKLSVNSDEFVEESMNLGSIVNKLKDGDSVLYQMLNVEEDIKLGMP